MNIIKKLLLLAVLTAVTTIIATGCSCMGGKCAKCSSGMSTDAKADHCAVCGGKLGDMGATCTTNYMGHQITCCSSQCMQTFSQNPDKYVAKAPMDQTK
jgi:YHS domain-containing protein